MREILFRGKCNEVGKYNGQWLEGFYAVDDGKPLIAHSTDNGLNGYFCEPGSIGEYTGVQDKNNRKIFENDIVSTPYYKGVVIFGEGCFCVKNGINTPAIDIVMNDFDIYVIGNIHDNPGLLEKNE